MKKAKGTIESKSKKNHEQRYLVWIDIGLTISSSLLSIYAIKNEEIISITNLLSPHQYKKENIILYDSFKACENAISIVIEIIIKIELSRTKISIRNLIFSTSS